MNFSQKVITFLNHLELRLPDTLNIEVLNPYQSPEVRDCGVQFYNKYFSDQQKRIFIMGINPGRFGSGLTGISFTDPVALRDFCGIKNQFGNKRELSSVFIYEMIMAYGGLKKFYSNFFITAVCPLGFMKGARNYNYYDDKELQNAVTPFIKKTFLQQIEIGAKNNALIVVGSDKNRKFVESLNNQIKFFSKIIPVEHPRFIMQYRRRKLDQYIAQYLRALVESTG